MFFCVVLWTIIFFFFYFSLENFFFKILIGIDIVFLYFFFKYVFLVVVFFSFDKEVNDFVCILSLGIIRLRWRVIFCRVIFRVDMYRLVGL